MTPWERNRRRRKRRRIILIAVTLLLAAGFIGGWKLRQQHHGRYYSELTKIRKGRNLLEIAYWSRADDKTGRVEVEFSNKIPTSGEGLVTVKLGGSFRRTQEPELFVPPSVALRYVPDDSDEIQHEASRLWRWTLSSENPRQCSAILRLPFKSEPGDIFLSTKLNGIPVNDTKLGSLPGLGFGIGNTISLDDEQYEVNYVRCQFQFTVTFTKLGMSPKAYDLAALLGTICVFLLGSGIAWRVVGHFRRNPMLE